MFRQDFIGGSYSLLDAEQNPLPVSTVIIIVMIMMIIIVVKGLLVVSSLQEVGWNKSPVCQGQFGTWTAAQSLRPLC